ncbi:hypothetical protein OD91_1363 [Lutibacter sp. Hel_I_33_5]|uniref:hypothetical protein n=1 Tax=Lutibacter sp. Hel_I_33_5 TaxID=1566289 RepID=UPI00119D6BB8|nr:hypothetical protein [Lutibacter sp. Hel_I_33_5]TVZ56084.1 hypothetical protein OD91_1363 [Lutibacter sp. Hel_I_33_5]
MNKTTLLFLGLIFTSSSLLAQTNNSKKLPISIYTFNKITKDNYGFASINKRLNIKEYDFAFVDFFDIENNLFTFDYKNFGRDANTFNEDDLKRYQNTNFTKKFLLKNDPTRWNLHNCNNRTQ